jgi:5'-nucleotidase
LPYYWLKGKVLTNTNTEDTDITAVKTGFVSLTPLKLDVTDFESINALKQIV